MPEIGFRYTPVHDLSKIEFNIEYIHVSFDILVHPIDIGNLIKHLSEKLKKVKVFPTFLEFFIQEIIIAHTYMTHGFDQNYPRNTSMHLDFFCDCFNLEKKIG